MNLINKKISLIISDDKEDLNEFIEKRKNYFDEFIKLNYDMAVPEIINLNNQNDLLISKKYFIIQNVDWFETVEKFNEKINDLIKIINDDIYLCIYLNKTFFSKSKKILDFVQMNFDFIEIESYDSKKPHLYIDKYLKKINLKLPNLIVEDLIAKTNHNNLFLKNEINKIKYLVNTKYSDSEVMNFISDYSDQQIFELLNYLYSNKMKEFISLFNKLLDNSINEVVIINMLITMMSTHYLIKKLDEVNKTSTEIAKIINKTDYLVKLNLRQIKNFNSNFLLNQIKLLIELDFLIKKGEADKRHAFFKWLFNFHKLKEV